MYVFRSDIWCIFSAMSIEKQNKANKERIKNKQTKQPNTSSNPTNNLKANR